MSEPMVLRVETGAITVAVEDENGRALGTFEFNPVDSNILKRFGEVAEHLNGLSIDEPAEPEEKMKRLNELCEDIAGQFDYLLGYPVSEGLFGKCGPLTITKDGDYYFEQVLDGVGTLIEQVAKKRVDKKVARLRKAAAGMPSAGK